MFERIKMKVIQGRKLKPFATAKVLQDHEDRLRKLEGEEPSTEPDSEPLPETTVTRDLTFNVTDGTDPIEGATVTIGTVSGTTGSAGGCTLKDIEEGSQSVSVVKEGYATKTETITVSEDNTSFAIELVADITPSGE